MEHKNEDGIVVVTYTIGCRIGMPLRHTKQGQRYIVPHLFWKKFQVGGGEEQEQQQEEQCEHHAKDERVAVHLNDEFSFQKHSFPPHKMVRVDSSSKIHFLDVVRGGGGVGGGSSRRTRSNKAPTRARFQPPPPCSEKDIHSPIPPTIAKVVVLGSLVVVVWNCTPSSSR